MAVKIRMQRHGSKKRPFYFIVAANSTAPRDGKFIEKVGTYNPLTVPATIELDRERALEWLQKGAQPTNTVRRILSFKGVLYMKHLMRGVSLGLFDEAEAKTRFEKWNKDHEALVAEREESHRKAKKEKRAHIARESVRRVEEKQAARKAESEAAATEAAETEQNEAAETAAGDAAATATEETADAAKAKETETTEEKK